MNCYIGLDLGGTNIAAGLVSETGELIFTDSCPTLAKRPATEVIADMAAQAQKCLAAAAEQGHSVLAVGIGVPGAVDDETGMVIFAPNLYWDQVPLGSMLEEALKLPVHLANDADCAVLGEMIAGNGSRFESALMITIGTGIGGGLARRGEIFRGWSVGGTEPGHMTLILGGQPCGCGKMGCYETYASATALIRQTREAMTANPNSALWQVAGSPEAVTAKTPFDAALLGDEVAIALLDRYEEYLAAGIGSIVNILRPQAVLIGGGVSNQDEVLLAPVRKKLMQHCYAAQRIAPPQVLKAALGNEAGIIGAALQRRNCN